MGPLRTGGPGVIRLYLFVPNSGKTRAERSHSTGEYRAGSGGWGTGFRQGAESEGADLLLGKGSRRSSRLRSH